MKIFAFLAPFLFVFLAACDFNGTVDAEFAITCPLPIPIITDTTLTGNFNAACPYYILENDTLRLVTPGVVKV